MPNPPVAICRSMRYFPASELAPPPRASGVVQAAGRYGSPSDWPLHKRDWAQMLAAGSSAVAGGQRDSGRKPHSGANRGRAREAARAWHTGQVAGPGGEREQTRRRIPAAQCEQRTFRPGSAPGTRLANRGGKVGATHVSLHVPVSFAARQVAWKDPACFGRHQARTTRIWTVPT